MSNAAEFTPTEFADLERPAQAFVAGMTVVVRLPEADTVERRRFIDFLSGLAYDRGRIHLDGGLNAMTLTPNRSTAVA